MDSISKPWLKFYNPKHTPECIHYPDISVYEFVRRSSEKFPDHIAYEFMEKETKYRDFISKTDRIAACLYSMGVRKGDNIVVCMPNIPQTVQAFYAIVRCGAVAVMVHPLSAKNEIEYYLNISHARTAFVLDSFVPNFTAVMKNTQLEKIIVADIRDELDAFKKIGYALTLGRKVPPLGKEDCIIRWKKFLGYAEGTDMPVPENRGNDACTILFSGGTTGTPKGIVLSNLNLTATAMGTLAISECLPIPVEDLLTERHDAMFFRDYTVLSVMPMFHGFGLGIGIHTFLAIGAKCILVPQFTPDSFAKLLVKKRPNFIAGVPALYERMIRSDALKNADLSCLDGMFSGGDSLTVEAKRRIDAFLKEHNAHITVREGYGLTESVTATCLTPVEHQREGSIGIPFPDVLFKICRVGTTESVPYGEDGEICLSGPNIMLGYFENPKETAEVLKVHDDGRTWLHSGDVGHMDEDGFIYFGQRYKRIIISSGYNIYPSQIENVLDRHPAIAQSCAIGIPHPIKQQVVKVFIVLEKGYEPSDGLLSEIREYAKENFSKFALPKEYEFIDRMPMTKVAKVAYRELEKLEAERAEKRSQ